MIAATVLAAGDSIRMGRPKALLDLAGKSFLATIIAKLEQVGVAQGYVVVGKHRDKILQANELGSLTPIDNVEPDAGPIGSVRSVLRRIEPEFDRLMIWPVDMPRIHVETIGSLLQADTSRPIVVPAYQGRRGHPIVLKKEIFQEIIQLPSGESLKHVVRRDPARVHLVPVEDPTILDSINTPEDYELVRGSREP